MPRQSQKKNGTGTVQRSLKVWFERPEVVRTLVSRHQDVGIAPRNSEDPRKAAEYFVFETPFLKSWYSAITQGRKVCGHEFFRNFLETRAARDHPKPPTNSFPFFDQILPTGSVVFCPVQAIDTDVTRRDLENDARALGAVVVASADELAGAMMEREAEQPCFVVADTLSADTVEALAILVTRSGSPCRIVRSSWIIAQKDPQTRTSEPNVLPPFAGLKVSCHPLSGEVKRTQEATLRTHGAILVSKLNEAAFVVFSDKESKLLDTARRGRKVCVGVQWVSKSIENGWALPAGHRDSEIPSQAWAVSGPLALQAGTLGGGGTLPLPGPQSNANRNTNAPLALPGIQETELADASQSLALVPVSETLEQQRGREQTAGFLALRGEGAVGEPGHWFRGCVVCVHFLGREAKVKCREQVVMGGGWTAEDPLDPQITHILIPPVPPRRQLQQQEKQEVALCVTSRRGRLPFFVKSSWLAESSAAKCLIAPDSFLIDEISHVDPQTQPGAVPLCHDELSQANQGAAGPGGPPQAPQLQGKATAGLARTWTAGSAYSGATQPMQAAFPVQRQPTDGANQQPPQQQQQPQQRDQDREREKQAGEGPPVGLQKEKEKGKESGWYVRKNKNAPPASSSSSAPSSGVNPSAAVLGGKRVGLAGFTRRDAEYIWKEDIKALGGAEIISGPQLAQGHLDYVIVNYKEGMQELRRICNLGQGPLPSEWESKLVSYLWLKFCKDDCRLYSPLECDFFRPSKAFDSRSEAFSDMAVRLTAFLQMSPEQEKARSEGQKFVRKQPDLACVKMVCKALRLTVLETAWDGRRPNDKRADLVICGMWRNANKGKLRLARREGISVVTIDWLVESYKQGRPIHKGEAQFQLFIVEVSETGQPSRPQETSRELLFMKGETLVASPLVETERLSQALKVGAVVNPPIGLRQGGPGGPSPSALQAAAAQPGVAGGGVVCPASHCPADVLALMLLEEVLKDPRKWDAFSASPLPRTGSGPLPPSSPPSLNSPLSAMEDGKMDEDLGGAVKFLISNFRGNGGGKKREAGQNSPTNAVAFSPSFSLPAELVMVFKDDLEAQVGRERVEERVRFAIFDQISKNWEGKKSGREGERDMKEVEQWLKSVFSSALDSLRVTLSDWLLECLDQKRVTKHEQCRPWAWRSRQRSGPVGAERESQRERRGGVQVEWATAEAALIDRGRRREEEQQ
uniref:BRCT domain-containing protein n=1 Tax=Chromera velia CCMP2878 TaxID=1169474 RepID=A0A0G4HID1_9ALVE|eukprot:Cvel_6973.t1-p1 / transcript=Cvel_6973.t1 / gene=Cvel_6973 / organism=Chromera_velia_CCMP2878 / gene_product=hypothetical protein / transcript_product=hypothetical protein / location=Cvel_scaffold354:31799-37712(+) / protein_length=1200 / sequence_SO=supercontig / SO=protein_coding / is_pseudo=false